MDAIDIQFVSSLLNIIMIDIVLGGDNAILIALATRKLPKGQRKKAIFWGVFGAIGIRALLTTIAVYVLEIPFVHLIGGLLLVMIAYKLLTEEDNSQSIQSGNSTMQAVKTIIVADLLMGIDNVLAVAGAAHGHPLLVVMGLLISVPIIVWGSNVILHFIERFPIITFIGAAIIAWTAGTMIVEDKFIYENLIVLLPELKLIIPITIIFIVVGLGFLKKRRDTSYHRV